MAQIQVVGNGPSRHSSVISGCDVCVCNIPQLDIAYDYISIVDRKAIDYINSQGLVFDKPILTTQELVKFVKTTPVKAVYKEKLMNSAATAAYYFAQDYDDIWLVGCDALWSDITTSHQDTLIPRSRRASNLHIRWRGFWERVWKTGKRFHIVCPQNIEEINYGKNVFWHHTNQSGMDLHQTGVNQTTA